MIPSWLRSMATGRAVAFAMILWLAAGVVLFQVGPYPSLNEMTQGLELLDERMGYSWQDAIVYLAVLGESGRRLYHTFLVADLGNAILVASAFTLLLTFLAIKLGLAQRIMTVLVFLPAAVGLLDVLENTLLMAAINQFADVSHPVVRVASWATQGKLVLGFATMTIVVIGILAWAVTTLRARTTKS